MSTYTLDSIRTSVATHTVLKNTYLLLSFTLFVTAIMSWLAMAINAQPINIWVQLIVGFALIFSIMATQESFLGIVFVVLFSAFEGYTLGPIFNHIIEKFTNGAELITATFATTSFIFATLSGYVIVTKKDFSFMGGFLFSSLLALIVISIIGLVFHIAALNLAVAFVGVLLFSGYILYDTSEIINGGETNYVAATVKLYLDFLNLFLDLLQIAISLFGESD